MTSLNLKKYYVSLTVTEHYHAHVWAVDADSAEEIADEHFSAVNIDGFTLDEKYVGPFVADEVVPAEGETPTDEVLP